MKLPPKPSGKARKRSPENTLTQRIDTGASPTSTPPPRMEDLVVSSPATPPVPEAEPPKSKNGQKKSSRVLVIAKSDLDPEETRELYYLGTAMAQMSSIRLYSDVQPFREGVERGKGRVSNAPDSSLDAFDAIFSYDTDNPFDAKEHIEMHSYQTLQQVVALAVRRLYELGTIK